MRVSFLFVFCIDICRCCCFVVVVVIVIRIVEVRSGESNVEVILIFQLLDL